MKITVVILFSIVAFIKTSHSQKLDWKQTENWRIYDIIDRQAIKVSIDSLKLLKSSPIHKDSVLYYISDAIVWPPTKNTVWMGAYTLTYELNPNQPRKLLISTYGRFIYDSFNKQYYEIDKEKWDAWLEFLVGHLNK